MGSRSAFLYSQNVSTLTNRGAMEAWVEVPYGYPTAHQKCEKDEGPPVAHESEATA
jgi:hypothetical protein